MNKNRIMVMIENYGDVFDTEDDMSTSEAREIIRASQSKMEIAENCYLYGHMRGIHAKTKAESDVQDVPVYDIPQLTDEEWDRLAARNRLERQVAV